MCTMAYAQGTQFGWSKFYVAGCVVQKARINFMPVLWQNSVSSFKGLSPRFDAWYT
jgi:hypothetical protein